MGLRNNKMLQQVQQRFGANAVQTAAAQVKAALPAHLQPGNIGDISKVVWPFWFTFSKNEISAGQAATAYFSVSREAAFIMMSISVSVFKVTGALPNRQYVAVPRAEWDEVMGGAPGLTLSLRDAQSQRDFMGAPIEIDHLGPAEFPTVIPTPQLILPSATIEARFQNNNSTDTYVPLVTVFGYRVRIEGQESILSSITG